MQGRLLGSAGLLLTVLKFPRPCQAARHLQSMAAGSSSTVARSPGLGAGPCARARCPVSPPGKGLTADCCRQARAPGVGTRHGHLAWAPCASRALPAKGAKSL